MKEKGEAILPSEKSANLHTGERKGSVACMTVTEKKKREDARAAMSSWEKRDRCVRDRAPKKRKLDAALGTKSNRKKKNNRGREQPLPQKREKSSTSFSDTENKKKKRKAEPLLRKVKNGKEAWGGKKKNDQSSFGKKKLDHHLHPGIGRKPATLCALR